MYHLDKQVDRRGYSQRWDEPLLAVPPEKELIPLWIADMDFATPPCVTDAMQKRLAHPTFGYYHLDARFYDAILGWWARHRDVHDLAPAYIQYQNSTVGGIVAAVQVMTAPGDGVLVHLPDYTGFTYGIADAGRKLIGSELVQDAEGVFRMDLADMEEKIVQEKIKCMILCSPHNPTGRVWTRAELDAAVALCEKYEVQIISDEVWADFVFAPGRHIPTLALGEYARQNSITVCGPAKTFNLAGLRVAYSITCNDELRARFQQHASANHYNVPNTLPTEALIGAYTEGDDYVEEVVAYIRANMEYAHAYVAEHLPAIGSYLPQGTYTMWLCLPKDGRTDAEWMERFAAEGLIVNPASDYSAKGWFRLNLACPRILAEKAMAALTRAVNA